MRFERPSSGQWEYLKYDYFAPNLEKLQNLMIVAFETSDGAMLKMYSNSGEMNGQLKKMVGYVALDQDTPRRLKTKQTLLFNSISTVKTLAADSIAAANQTIARFDASSRFIGKLRQHSSFF